MTLNKKTSRTIIVNDKKYNWLISSAKEHLNLIIEPDEKGQKLEIHVEPEIDNYYIDSNKDKSLNFKTITPKNISNIIPRALEIGWKPTEKGKTLILVLDDNKLFKKD